MSEPRHEVRLTRRAQKDLKKLRHDATRALNQIAILESDPFRGEPLKGDLREARSLHFTLKGGGQYRAIYVLMEDGTACVVFLIGARENVYEEARRRFEAMELD